MMRLPAPLFLLLLMSFILALPHPGHTRSKMRVVATIKPIHSLVAGVMKGIGKPYLLIKNGSPHHTSMRPSEARALQKANLVFWVGPELETFLISPMQVLADKALIISLKKSKGLTLHVVHETQSHNHRHQPKMIDPHIWLDPRNAQAMIAAIAKALSHKDPDNKEAYGSNAEKMISRLDHMTDWIQTALMPLRTKPYMTFHDDFQYFERRFNLTYAGSIITVSGRRAGARQLKKLRDIIRRKNIKCVFSEPRFKPALVDLLIEGSKARGGSLDLIGANLAPGPELYFTLLDKLAKSFKACLSSP